LIVSLLRFKISSSRTVHGFFSLSNVSAAWEEFNLTIKRFNNFSSKKDANLVQKNFKSIQPIKMKIGSSKCHNDFFLVALSLYADAYATGALWP